MPVLTALLVAALALLVWVYLGYPAVVAVAATVRPLRLRTDQPWPSVTVAIAVHNEEPVIAERVRNALDQATADRPIAEVLVGSDGSTDGTVEIARALAREDARVRVLDLPRAGQTAAQHALIEEARGDVVVLTDAETVFAAGALTALVAPFRDARVGASTGHLEWRNERATATSRNEGFYWRYERRVRNLESRAGWLTAVTGAFLAVRRTAYRPVPATASMDHLLPLYVREQGGRVVYVPEALATDRPISGLREQFRNRSRTATRGIRANLSMVRRLTPWRRPTAALAIWSHKLLRWATPLLLALAIAAATSLGASGQPLAFALPALVGLVLAAALAAHLLTRAGRAAPRVLAFARAFTVVNAAFLVAWWNVVLGRGISTWRSVAWEAERR